MLVTLKLKRGMKPTEEQLSEIYANAPKSDEEIDYSDIPPLTYEEIEKMKENRRRRKNLTHIAREFPRFYKQWDESRLTKQNKKSKLKK